MCGGGTHSRVHTRAPDENRISNPDTHEGKSKYQKKKIRETKRYPRNLAEVREGMKRGKAAAEVNLAKAWRRDFKKLRIRHFYFTKKLLRVVEKWGKTR